MVNIFFDLDGTIVNSQYRLYNLFIELCPECKMSYNDYWKIKRGKITQKDLLIKYFNYSVEQCEFFHKIWMKRIEEEERLREDFLVTGIYKVLENLSEKYSLYVVTNRQSEERTHKELEALNIKHLFLDVMVTEQKRTKSQLIKECVDYSKQDFIIGDTGEDIKAAHDLGINSVAVTWGIMDEEILKQYKPDIIMREVSEIGSYFI